MRSAMKISVILREYSFSGLRKKLRATCWVMVDPPEPLSPPVSITCQAARTMPCQSTPG